MRRSQQSAFANPVLVGAVTVLATLVAVFLAYNANAGLPFVPTKQLKVDIANGSNLVVGNDVREGGFRIGLVSALKPIELPNGTPGAQLTLQLNKSNGDIPVDSTVSILPRSVLGLKYVDLVKGTSTQTYPDGGVMSIDHTTVPVQFDDLNKIWDKPTRTAVDQNLVGYGDTFTGRGSALNDTIANLPELFKHLQPVAHYLSQPGTGLTRFFTSLNTFMGVVAPVAAVNAKLFADQASTFEAISRDPNALESTIQQSPSTEDVSTDSLKAQQPFLVDLTTFGQKFTPATAALRDALPDINPALETGAQVLPRTPQLNNEVNGVLSALKDLSVASGTNTSLNALTSTVSTLNPMMKYLGPFVTVCGGWTNWWTFLSDVVSEQTQFGEAQRALINFTNHAQDNVGSIPADQPASGQPDPTGSAPEYLHGQAYGPAVTTTGAADCETGQRGFPWNLNYFDPKKRPLGTDQYTPGIQGPTFGGRPAVPAGETFTRVPLTGPQTPYNPVNH